MLKTVRTRIAEMIGKGMGLEAITAAKPTADFDPTFGDVTKSLGFIDRVYTSLTKKK